MTEKPPVPSDLVAQARHFLLRLQPNLIDGRRVLDELGDSIECAESCLRENIAQRNEADARANAADHRIAELEAEVAELRKQADRDEDDADQLWEILGKFAGSAESLKTAARRAIAEADAAPRRTPELTERVAMWLKEHGQDWPIALCRADAAALLDLVFGKGQS